MDFAPAPSRGGLVGLGLMAAVLVVQGALVLTAVRLGFGPWAAVLLVSAALLLPLLARLAFWWWGWRTMSYFVSRDGIVVRWGPTRQAIPMGDITHVLNGRPYASRLRGWHWPGHWVGHTTIAPTDDTAQAALVFATRPPAEQVLIVTPGLTYAISPADRGAFVEEFRIRHRLGSVQALSQSADQPGWARRAIWRDRLALRLAALAAGLNLLAFAWLVWRYPGLGNMVPLQLAFDPTAHVAVPAGLRPRGAIWSLPMIGLAGMALNSVLAWLIHPHDRVAALLLLAGAVSLELALAFILGNLF